MLELDFNDETPVTVVTGGEMTNAEYHAHPALGSSNLKKILKNPYAFAAKIAEKQTKAKDMGSAVHVLILEPHKFSEEFAVMPELNLRTNAGKEEKAAFEAANVGKTILKKDEYDTAMACANAVLKAAGSFFKGGVAEHPFFSEFDGMPVKCKPDYYIEELGVVVDLKKCTDASPDGFQRDAAKYGYYVSVPYYLDILRSLDKRADRFIYVCVEEEFPHMVGVYEYDQASMDFGRSEYQRALDIYKRIDEYSTPIYKDTLDSSQVIQTITVPSYVYYKNNASY